MNIKAFIFEFNQFNLVLSRILHLNEKIQKIKNFHFKNPKFKTKLNKFNVCKRIENDRIDFFNSVSQLIKEKKDELKRFYSQ